MTAIITLPNGGGHLLVTDVETSGDQFQIFDNGVPAQIDPAAATGLIPGGQQALAPGLTSVPTHGMRNVGKTPPVPAARPSGSTARRWRDRPDG